MIIYQTILKEIQTESIDSPELCIRY